MNTLLNLPSPIYISTNRKAKTNRSPSGSSYQLGKSGTAYTPGAGHDRDDELEYPKRVAIESILSEIFSPFKSAPLESTTRFPRIL